MNEHLSSDYAYLHRHRRVWRSKPVLQRLYREQFYRPLLNARASGDRTLEIGSGPGFLQEIDPAVWRTDILPSPWVHCAADVHHMPFAASTFDNLIGLDVLHHFNQPLAALREMARVLRPGGRLALVEPWITPFSRLIYTYLHQEECDLRAEPWREDQQQFDAGKEAFEGNAAIPYLLIRKSGCALEESLAQLQLVKLEPFSSLTYLLSGGFKRFNLLPGALYPALYALERGTRPLWARYGALRALIVWQKAE